MQDPQPRTFHSPKQRQYEERDRGRDVDEADRINRLRALVWSLVIFIVAVPIGLLVGGFPWGLLGAAVAAGLVYAGITGIAEAGVWTAGEIHNPRREIAPVRRDYSYAQSLAARGDFVGAIREYEVAVASVPTDPEPYLRIARIHRRNLGAAEDALLWFKRVRTEAEIGRGQELVVTQEIIEIYRDDLGTPARAIPELARLIDRFPDDPGVAAAREELARLRRELAAE